MYVVVVGALQETKWFGSEVYEVNDSVILTSLEYTCSGISEGRRSGAGA